MGRLHGAVVTKPSFTGYEAGYCRRCILDQLGRAGNRLSSRHRSGLTTSQACHLNTGERSSIVNIVAGHFLIQRGDRFNSSIASSGCPRPERSLFRQLWLCGGFVWPGPSSSSRRGLSCGCSRFIVRLLVLVRLIIVFLLCGVAKHRFVASVVFPPLHRSCHGPPNRSLHEFSMKQFDV